MHHLKSVSRFISLIVCVTVTLPGAVFSQSGRGRPRVPSREPAAPPPPPVKVPASTAVIKQEQAGSTSRFQLRNGMTVVISEQHAFPVAAAVAFFKAGHLDEPAGARGASRLLARAMLSGTEGGSAKSNASADSKASVNSNASASSPAARLQSLGAIAGADASARSTSFYFVAPSKQIAEALGVQANLLSRAAAEPAAASLWMNQDEPARYSMARLYDLAFNQEAATHAPGGAITGERVEEFYKAVFKPDNLVLTIAGDVSTFNTLVAIQQLYGDFGVSPAPETKDKPQLKTQPAPSRTGGRPARPEPAQPAGTPPAAQTAVETRQAETKEPGLRYRSDRADLSQSVVSIGFLVPGPESKEAPALDLIAAILGQGRGARLRDSLLDGAAVLSRVESHYIGAPEKGLLATQMWTDPAQIDKAESEFFRAIDQLRREIPAEGDMARARGVLEKAFVDEMGTYLGRASRLAQAEAYGGGFRAALDYRNRIRAVSAEEVQRVAAKYLTLVNTRVHEYEPFQAAARTFDSERFSAAVAGWAPGFAQAVNSARAAIDPNAAPVVIAQGAEKSADQQAAMESVEPLAVRDFSTLNGPRAYVREDHTQPKVAVAVLMQVGRLAEEEATSGLTELMLQAMMYGTARRTARQVAGDLDQLGAEIEIVSDPDFFGFMLSVLSRNADRALKIVRDLVEEPAFRDEDVARARVLQAGIIREHRDSSPSRSHDLLFQALFPNHSYSLPSRGREESVAKLTAEQVREWHAKLVKRQLPLVVIVGDTDGSALVSSVIAEGFRRREVDKTFSAKIPGPRPPAERADARRSPLSVVSLGFMGPKAGSADAVVLELIKALLNGEGGRLATELRDRQSAAYQAHFDAEQLLTSGAVYAQIFASADQEQRARQLALAEFDRLARAPLSANEVESARAFAALSRQAAMQSHEARAIEYARTVFSQQQATKVDDLIQDLSKLTPEDVRRVASLYFKPSGASVGAVRGSR